MLSIIIPTWGAENFIEECLDSIVSQKALSDIEYEIILGIDHCEKSLSKVKEIRHKYDSNLKVIWTEKNGGLFVTINTLISVAKYDYILKFDADDIMLPDLIETIWPHRNQYDLIRFGFYFYYSQSDKNKLSPSCARGVFLANKRIYEKFGGYKSWKCSADSEFLYRLESTNTKQLNLSNKRLFYYRQHTNSLTNHKDTGMRSHLRDSYRRTYYGKPVTNIYVEPEINTYIEI